MMNVHVHLSEDINHFLELEIQKRLAEQEKRAYEDTVRERDMLSKVYTYMYVYVYMLV